jgi:sulfonate transport system substrate-binding protein
MPSPPAPGVDRRLFLTSLLGATAAAAGLSGCAENTAAAGTRGTSSASPADKVPAGTSLKIASYQNVQQLQFKLAGRPALPFTVSSSVNIGAGPDVLNAFRARSLDLADNAGIPPIPAHCQGLDSKIVAIDITRGPTSLFATKPGSDIRTVEDFKGRRLAFSQGQAQGVVLLRALKRAGLKYDEVDLVPLTSNRFLTALQSGQVDVAPLADQQAPVSVLNDPAKAAAVAAYIPQWANHPAVRHRQLRRPAGPSAPGDRRGRHPGRRGGQGESLGPG